MKGVVVYVSKYGATASYAKWLGEALGFEVIPAKKAKDVSSYDTVLMGGWIMAGKPKIAGWVNQNFNQLNGKKLVFFTTSGAMSDAAELTVNYENAFSADIRSKMKYFPLNGKLRISEMKWFDRKMMGMFAKMTAKTNPEEAAKMINGFDRVNKDEINPIVDYILKG